MHAIESKDNFELEAAALLAKINSQIEASSNFKGSPQSAGKSGVVPKLNVLKTQEYKVKEALEKSKIMSEEEWIEQKEALQNDFNEALKAFEASALN